MVHAEIPRYTRTRIVRVKWIQQKRRVTCSCQHYQRHQRTCRHIRCVFPTKISTNDFGIVNTKIYCAHYGKLQSFTQFANDHLLSNTAEGPLLSETTLPSHVNLIKDKLWFEEALPGQIQTHPDCVLIDTTLHSPIFSTIEDDNDIAESEIQPNQELFIDGWNNSHSELLPIFNRCSDLVTNKESYTVFQKGMTDLMQKLTMLQANKSDYEANTVSLPSVDNRKKDKRKAPLMSPSRNKKLFKK